MAQKPLENRCDNLVDHFLGIDLESWALNPAFRHLTPMGRKQIDGGATPRQIERFLDELRRARQRVTWFVASELFTWDPQMIRAIAQEGHEIAYHTHSHPEPITAEILEQELANSGEFLATFHPLGFRAPRLLMPSEAYPVLARAGFRYSSSIYGNAGRSFVQQGIVELPVSSAPYAGGAAEPQRHGLSMSFLCRQFPYGSGVSLGLMGGRGVAWWIRRQERAHRRSNLFVHSWQQQPMPAAMRRAQWRMAATNPLLFPYFRDVLSSLRYLLERFQFKPCRTVLADQPGPGLLNEITRGRGYNVRHSP